MSDDAEKEQEEHKDIAVAKINARQAITITLITTVSGMVVAGFTGYMSARSSESSASSAVPPQRWLVIEGIKPTGVFPEGSPVRVVAIVNSQAFSYPSRALWARIGPSMSSEKFPLPIESEQYQVRFELFLEDSSGKEPSVLTSQETQSVSVSSLVEPIVRDYQLFSIDGKLQRAAEPLLTVTYELR